MRDAAAEAAIQRVIEAGFGEEENLVVRTFGCPVELGAIWVIDGKKAHAFNTLETPNGLILIEPQSKEANHGENVD